MVRRLPADAPPADVAAERRARAANTHRMMLAFPSNKVARRTGLNRNHMVRVWCTCQADQISEPGMNPSGLYWTDRPSSVVVNDPRRLGGWDYLGVADVRVPNSALDLWRAHVAAAKEAHRATH